MGRGLTSLTASVCCRATRVSRVSGIRWYKLELQSLFTSCL